MIVRAIEILVKPERTAEFIAATLENHRGSLREPGVLRFDVLQSAEDPARFQEDGPLRGLAAGSGAAAGRAAEGLGLPGPGPRRPRGLAGSRESRFLTSGHSWPIC
jgi:hypothetical protein